MSATSLNESLLSRAGLTSGILPSPSVLPCCPHTTGSRRAASAGYDGLLKSGEDLLAVQVKLRRPDAVDGGQLLERRRVPDRDRPQHGIRGDDERRHLVGAGA